VLPRREPFRSSHRRERSSPAGRHVAWQSCPTRSNGPTVPLTSTRQLPTSNSSLARCSGGHDWCGKRPLLRCTQSCGRLATRYSAQSFVSALQARRHSPSCSRRTRAWLADNYACLKKRGSSSVALMTTTVEHASCPQPQRQLNGYEPCGVPNKIDFGRYCVAGQRKRCALSLPCSV
jgi:hypothetical protein